MKAIDTNVLVRFLVNDDPRQSPRVKALFQETESRGERLLVSLPAFLETLWVLESSYHCPKPVIYDMIDSVMRLPVLCFEAEERIKSLSSIGRHTPMDPADLLLGLSAHELGCSSTFTFDRRAARNALFELLQ